MPKTQFTFIAVLLAAASLMGSLAQADPKPNAPATASDKQAAGPERAAAAPAANSDRQYDPKGRFSIVLPKDWVEGRQEGHYQSPDNTGYTESLTTGIKKDPSIGPTAYLDKAIPSMQKRIPGFKEIERWELKIDDKPAVGMIYTFKVLNQDCKNVLYVVSQQDRHAFMTFSTLSESFDEWKDQFQKSAVTFRFTRPGDPPPPKAKPPVVPDEVPDPNAPKDSSQILLTLRGHAGSVDGVKYSPDGKQLASFSQDKTIRLWDSATGKSINYLPGHRAQITGIDFSPDGTQLASGSVDEKVYLWDVKSGELQTKLEGARGFIFGVAYSPDGKTLASWGNDIEIQLWDLAQKKPLRKVGSYRIANINSVKFHPDGKSLAAVALDPQIDQIKLWDVASGKEVRAWKTDGMVDGMAFSPDGKMLAGVEKKGVTFWNSATGEVVRQIPVKYARLVAFSPDGKRVATASSLDIRIFDVVSSKEVLALTGHSATIHDLSFSPDGTRLASASYDKKIKIWNVKTE